MIRGGAGADWIIAGGGADVLVGAGGADTLEGGAGSDLLLAATTNLGNDSVGLAYIHEVWRSGSPYADRVAAISGAPGSGSAPYFLLPSTIVNDSAVDELFGQDDEDWFLYDPALDLLDDVLGEVTTDIEP